MNSVRLSRSIVGEREADAVRRIICEDGYLGIGNEVRRFESDLAAYLGIAENEIISVNSGTAALHLAVQAILAQTEPAENPEVLVPSLTFVASFQAISAAGAIPVPCEICEDTATLDLADAEKRITERTRILMPVHYASNPVDLNGIYAFAQKHHLRVIEDAAHAFGCSYKGKKIGAFGDVVCFSFDGIKNITCGEGGCICTKDQDVASICRDARLLGVSNDTEKRFRGARSWDADVCFQGWRYHLSNIMAAIGRVQLSRLDNEFAPARKKLAAIYRKRLAAIPGIRLFAQEHEADIIPHIFPIRVADGKRKKVAEYLDAVHIPTGRHYKPNHLLSFYGGGKLSLPITEKVYSELLTLPLHPGLAPAEIEGICDAIAEALAEHSGQNTK